MDNYSDPAVPEGINVKHDHPLLDFGGLLLGVALITATIVLLLVLSASWLSRYIPFSYEQNLAASVFKSDLAKDFVSDKNATPQHHEIERYLQELAGRIAIAQEFPADMPVIIHYVDSKTVNAFATLGGHIVMYSGLVGKLESENALTLLLAHEMAHIKHRDPVVALGRGLTLMLGLIAISGTGDASGLAESMVGDVSLMTTLGFSRRQEKAADELALQTVTTLYGHAAGAEQLFDILKQENKGEAVPAFLSTHPDTDARYEMIRSASRANSDATLTELPGFMLQTTSYQSCDNKSPVR